MVSDEELRRQAKKIAKEKIGFYVHFLVYILVNIFLFAQWYWLTGGEGFPWVIPATVGWGIGIIAHFIGVFIIEARSTKLEEKEYQKLKEMEK